MYVIIESPVLYYCGLLKHVVLNFAFSYVREQDITILDEYQYPDTRDIFERPPYCVKVSAKTAGNTTYLLV